MSCTRTSTSIDSLGMNQSIREGENLVSASGSFELGFFSPGTSTNRYLGVWYKEASGNQTVVWVANRKRPVHNRSGVLILNAKGILQLLDDTNSTIWSSNISGKALNNSIAQLLDSGNLVVKNGQDTKEGSFLWQSFDYPSDTLMPGMKLGLNLVTGQDRFLSSWKSADDPAVGEYSIKIDPRGYPRVVKMKGSIIDIRAGSWNGLHFTGYPSPIPNILRHDLVLNDKEVYYEMEILDRSIFYIYRMNHLGSGQLLVWTSQTRSQVQNTPTGGQDRCESYAFCGSNSLCSMDGNVATCECLKGYVPKFPKQWNTSYWSNGCVRKTALDCSNTYGFLRYTDVKLPDTSSSWFSKTMNLEECQKSCLKNCSCTAYANMDIRNGGSGCLLWFDHLIDMRQFSKGGQDLYIKVLASELGTCIFSFHFLFHSDFLWTIAFF